MKMEIRIKWLIINFVFVIAAWFFDVKATSPTTVGSEACLSENTAFFAGETLTYQIYYNWNFVWLSAGEITFKVLDDEDQYHYQVVGKTYPSYNWFFEVEDYFDTWVQKDDLLPVRSIKSIKEGKYRLYDDLTFDQSRRAVYNERGKAKDDIRERHNFTLGGCMHDMVSILYFCRNLDFSNSQPGQSFPIKIFADKETWPLNVTFERAETDKKVKGEGRFNTLKFSPQVIEGDVFPEGAQVHVWVSDDANKLPLMIESPLSVGSAKAIIKGYSGLRHPLNAKVGD